MFVKPVGDCDLSIWWKVIISEKEISQPNEKLAVPPVLFEKLKRHSENLTLVYFT